jgi:hypothetical protein
MLLVHTLHKLCIYLLLFLDIFLLDCMKHSPYLRGRCDDGFYYRANLKQIYVHQLGACGKAFG